MVRQLLGATISDLIMHAAATCLRSGYSMHAVHMVTINLKYYTVTVGDVDLRSQARARCSNLKVM